MEKGSIVIYGGSFNPPLNSHFSIAQQVLNQFEEVEKIVFIPVNKKYPKDGLLENKHRYNMLKLVANKNSEFIVSDIDMYGEKSLSTIETLEKTGKQFPNKDMWFLIGSDNLKELYTWNRLEELLSKYDKKYDFFFTVARCKYLLMVDFTWRVLLSKTICSLIFLT